MLAFWSLGSWAFQGRLPPLSLRFLPQSVLTLSRNEGAGGEHTAPGRAMKLSGHEEVTPHLTEVTISQDNNNFDSSVYLI